MNVPNIYKPFIGLVTLFTVISALNLPILSTLWRHSFDDGTYSHAYLIPIISFYLYFKLSEAGLLIYRQSISFIPLGLLLVGGLLLFVTSNAQISMGYWLSFLGLLTAGVISLFRFNWYILFPALFLIFIIPLWGILTNTLQSVSVIAVTYMMSFTGIPTYVEAQFITIPAGVFEIADGCSGLRYIIVSLAISSLFIFMYINNVKKASMFFLVAILGALLTNWIRITALILIGEYTNMESDLMEDHNTFGWYLYIPFMFLLFMWGNKLVTTDLLNTKPAEEQDNIALNKLNLIISLCLCVIFSTSVKSVYLKDVKLETGMTTMPSIVPEVFSPSDITISDAFIGNHSKLITYHFNGKDLDAKPTYFGNKLIPNGWNKEENFLSDNWNVNILSKGRKNILVLFQYEIDGLLIATAGKFKLQRLIKGISGNRKTKLHWIYVECKSNCNDELSRL